MAAVARRRLSFALPTGYEGPEAIAIVEERWPDAKHRLTVKALAVGHVRRDAAAF